MDSTQRPMLADSDIIPVISINRGPRESVSVARPASRCDAAFANAPLCGKRHSLANIAMPRPTMSKREIQSQKVDPHRPDPGAEPRTVLSAITPMRDPMRS